MKNSLGTIFVLTLFLVFVSFNSFGQEVCCVSQDIDGSTCSDCTSPGWNASNGTPDLTDEDVWEGVCFLLGLSSSLNGGGYAILGSSEGITTTISDLVVGNTYVYGFQYANPGFSCIQSDGQLTLELDGTTITYPQVSDWTTVYECFTASSSEIRITLTSNPINGALLGLSVVDALPCDYVSANNTCVDCCDIQLEYNETPEVCPGIPLEIEPTVSGVTGTFDLEWSSIPSEGINFLNNTNIVNPTFSFPYQDENQEQEYVFTLKVMQGNCENEIDISITVLASEIPIFSNINLCNTNLIEDLPQVSDDGYNGSWSGDAISEYADEFINLTFNVDINQNNCLDTLNYDFYVNPSEMVTFDIDEKYCVNDSTDYSLPSISLEDILGNWTPSIFNPASLGVGEHFFLFEGDDSLNCVQPLEFTLEVLESTTLTFDIPDTLCVADLPYVFPTISDQGVVGVFSIESITNQFVEDTLITIEFLPNSNGCLEEFNATIAIINDASYCGCDPYYLEITTTDISCEALSFGAIEIQPYRDEVIVWDNNSTDFSLSNLEAGQYNFTILYQNGECTYRDSINITQPDSLDFALQTFPSDCEEAQNGIIEITDIVGGMTPYNFSIDGTNYQNLPGFYNLSGAEYNVFVQDLDSCITMKKAVVEISNLIDIILPSDITISLGESIILNPLIEESSIDSFLWTPIEYILNPGELIAEVQPEETTTYSLIIFYGECVEVRTIQITIDQNESDFYFPNVISINDPSNSTFYVQSNLLNSELVGSLYIYDRWGNVVFINENLIINDLESGWNPKESFDYVPGVYVYKLLISNSQNESSHFVGTITVTN